MSEITQVKIYFENKTGHDVSQILSEQTCSDMNLEDFFEIIDYTSSCVGKQYLYDRLRCIPFESEIKKHEAILSQIDQTDKYHKILKQLSGRDAYYICSMFQEEHPQKPAWFMRILNVMQFLPLFCLCIFLIYSSTFWLSATILFFITNLVYHYKTKQLQLLYINSIPQVLKLIKVAKTFSNDPIFQNVKPRIKEQLKAVDSIRKQISLFRFDTKLDSEMAALIWLVNEFYRIFFLLEPVTLFRAFKEVNEKREALEEVFSFVGCIDMILSVKELRQQVPFFCEPTWKDSNQFQVKKMYHPLIADCIANDMNINEKSILLTGSNMSGKTTFMRTVMLNMLSAQTLNTCFAETFVTRKRNISSSINLSDSLNDARSLYMQEVLSVKEMLDESVNGKANLFVLDELFKGTNTLERIAAGKAVLSALNKNQNLVFASTHDIELADLLAEDYQLYHFCEQIREDQLHFDYQLKPGKLTETNAIRILEMKGYPPEVVAEANETVLIMKSLR